MAKGDKLQAKQRKFAEVFSGNGTKAAREAGYRGDDKTLAVTAAELLRNPKVAEIIRTREEREVRPMVMSRQQRQELWSEIARDKKEDTAQRLKASELLGKSEADFVDRLKHEGDVHIVVENPFTTPLQSPKPQAPALESPPVEPSTDGIEDEIHAEESAGGEEDIPDPEEH